LAAIWQLFDRAKRNTILKKEAGAPREWGCAALCPLLSGSAAFPGWVAEEVGATQERLVPLSPSSA